MTANLRALLATAAAAVENKLRTLPVSIAIEPMTRLRPLPVTIALMIMLVGVKTAGLVEAVGIGVPARASSTHPPQGQPPVPAKSEPAKLAPAPAKPAQPAAPAPEPQISKAERKALLDLRARSTQLDAETARLDEREALLSAAERRLTERMQQMTALQTKLEQLDQVRREREEANWRGLVKTYESMRPRDAAAIFNDLESAVLIQVVDRMNARKVAPILAAMAPERARAVTAQLAKWRSQTSAAPHLDAVQAHK